MRCEAMRGIEGARGQWIANQDSDHLLCSVSRSLPPGRPMRCAGHTPHMRHSKKLMLRDPQSSHRGTDRELEGGRQQVLGCLRMRGGSCYWRESEFFGSLDPDIDPRGDIWRTSAWRRKIRQRQEERESHRTVISTPFGTTEYVSSPSQIGAPNVHLALIGFDSNIRCRSSLPHTSSTCRRINTLCQRRLIPPPSSCGFALRFSI